MHLDFSDTATIALLRIWLTCAGLAIAVHAHCMANFTITGPWLLRFVLFPAATGCGVGMVWGGLADPTGYGMFFATVAAGVLVAEQLTIWAAGVKVSRLLKKVWGRRS